MLRKPAIERVLDGKHVFLIWWKLGNLNKVIDQLTMEGVISPRTGKQLSKAGVAASSWRYAIRNPEESYQLALEFATASGGKLSRNEWNIQSIAHARGYLTKAGYTKFIKKNKLEELALTV